MEHCIHFVVHRESTYDSDIQIVWWKRNALAALMLCFVIKYKR